MWQRPGSTNSMLPFMHLCELLGCWSEGPIGAQDWRLIVHRINPAVSKAQVYSSFNYNSYSCAWSFSNPEAQLIQGGSWFLYAEVPAELQMVGPERGPIEMRLPPRVA